MSTFYKINEELKQEHLYKFIFTAPKYEYQVSIDTDIEKLSIGEVDEETLETYEELQTILCDGSVYEQIGFLMMERIDIEKITLLKKAFRCVIYPNAVYLNGDIEELKKCFMWCGFNPGHWIGEEIKQGYF